MKKILDNPVYRFLLIGLSLYLVWISLYEILVVPNIKIHFIFGDWISKFVALFMGWVGIETYVYYDTFQVIIGLKSSPEIAVWIGEPCNGLKLFGLYTIFIIAYPSKNYLHKLWIIPLGIVLIHIINVLRVIALILIFEKYPEWIDFNHDYTFTILVYSFIFLLWWLFIKKFGKEFGDEKNN